jgi:hypothetical protein
MQNSHVAGAAPTIINTDTTVSLIFFFSVFVWVRGPAQVPLGWEVHWHPSMTALCSPYIQGNE